MDEGTIVGSPVAPRSMTIGLAIRDIKRDDQAEPSANRTDAPAAVHDDDPANDNFSFCSATSSAVPSVFRGLDDVDDVVPGIFLEAVLIGGMTTAPRTCDPSAGGNDRSLPQPADGPLGVSRPVGPSPT